MELFLQVGDLEIDHSKETIGFFSEKDVNEYSHIHGCPRLVIEILKEKYNVVYFGTGNSVKNNYFKINSDYSDDLLRKADDSDYIKKNRETLNNSMKRCFENLPKLKYLFVECSPPSFLPLITYCKVSFNKTLYEMQNEYFDYVGDDQTFIKKIDECTLGIMNRFDSAVSTMAFSTKFSNTWLQTIKFLHDESKIGEVISFIIDPVFYTAFYKYHKIPSRFYYFADDKRGTRNFQNFPIAQLQHIHYDSKFSNDALSFFLDEEKVEQKKNLLFAGTIFYEKGDRQFVWEKYLRNLKTSDCEFYIPLRKNGIVMNGKEKSFQLEEAEKAFPELWNEIKNDERCKGNIEPILLKDKVKEFKYAMVFHCVSKNDSLNFRPIFYVMNGVLPLLDERYDPQYLQIPKHIQDRIVVKNSNEIDLRIRFYNLFPEERDSIITELHKHFEISKWQNYQNVKDYVNQLF